jgi:hypothetical protein
MRIWRGGWGLMAEADTDFEAFLRGWESERIWRIDDFLQPHDQQYMAALRATELTKIACEKGFDDDLPKIAERFGSVLQYVRHLFWDVELRATTQSCSNPARIAYQRRPVRCPTETGSSL